MDLWRSMAFFSSLGSQRKGGLGDRFKGLASDELPLPIVSLVANLMGSLRAVFPNPRSADRYRSVDQMVLGHGTGAVGLQ